MDTISRSQLCATDALDLDVPASTIAATGDRARRSDIGC
jgi:hypothetical protein